MLLGKKVSLARRVIFASAASVLFLKNENGKIIQAVEKRTCNLVRTMRTGKGGEARDDIFKIDKMKEFEFVTKIDLELQLKALNSLLKEKAGRSTCGRFVEAE